MDQYDRHFASASLVVQGAGFCKTAASLPENRTTAATA